MRVVFGGTFDPVHIGHLRMANTLAEVLSVKQVSMMPCFKAVHKLEVGASSEHRVGMLALAKADDPLLALDTREIKRDKASYTFDSLCEHREELGDESLCFVMGMDAADGLSSWFKVERFSELTHLVIINRSVEKKAFGGKQAVAAKLEKFGFTQAGSESDLKKVPVGLYIFVDLPLLEISSTSIRNRIKQELSIRYLVTDAVRGYICDNALYQN